MNTRITLEIDGLSVDKTEELMRLLRGTEAPPVKATTTKGKAKPKVSETKEEPEDEYDALVDQAVDQVTKMLADGGRDRVVEALKDAGVRKVTSLEDADQVRAFLDSLSDE